jgi:hypothetical protein
MPCHSLRRPVAVALAVLSALCGVSSFVRVRSVGAQPAPAGPRDDASFSFYARGPYRLQVPRPDSVLGYALGTAHTQFHQQERVLLAIADAAKDRVAVEVLGQTAERRTMRLYVVSSPRNIARLAQLKADLDRVADPRRGTAAEREAAVSRAPAVVWFSGSVHGDEVPGFEASMALLYHFAASDEPETLRLLDSAIVIINPSSNPDGHERFTVWSNAIAVGSPERMAMEQQRGQPWSIAGRYNHYRFDMNRDVFAQTQQEVRHLVRGMLAWHPMVTADLHGYTATYFMAPASRPVNTNIASGWPVKWGEIIGAGNAAAFDRWGWMYNVRDNFDLYYPGYWDSWPSLNGAMGATYETDGGPALLKKRADGTLLSLRDGIAKHFTAAVATFETTARRARERVRDYAAFRQSAVDVGRTQPMKRVVFSPGSDPARAAELATMLLRNGIEVQRLTASLPSTKARAYADDAVAARTFAAGHYVVDLAQPQGRLAKALLEPDPALDPVFAKRMTDIFVRNRDRGRRAEGEGFEFYDITAWSLPVAFGVEAWSTEDAAPMTAESLALPADGARINGELLPVAVAGGVLGGTRARSAYLFRNDRNGAARLAAALMREGFRLGIATEPLQTGARDWPRGTWVARVSRNDSTLHARMDALARVAGVEVTAAETAFPETAQFGTGSGVVRDVPAPKVALVGGDGVFQGGYGALWWSFETRYDLPFTPITVDALNGDLSPFTVIVVPTGGLGRLGKAANLRAWIEKGGTLVTMGNATVWAAGEDVGLTTARVVEPEKKDPKPGDVPKAATDSAMVLASPGAAANADTPAPVPGSHFDVVFDRTHWLTLGWEMPRTTVLYEGNDFLRLSKDGANVGVFAPTGKLLRAGFSFPDNTERLLKGTAFLLHERVGSGHLVAFTNEPMFRGWWRGLDRLVFNAILLGGAF